MLTAVNGAATVTFTYDPIGRLSTTAVPTSTTFLYDSDRLVAEYDAAGTVLRRYVHGPGVDEPLVWYEGASTSYPQFLHQDRQGSVIAWSSVNGYVDTPRVYKYGPWGEPGDAWGAGSRFRYTGQIAIPEARLYHYKARMYDPATGRFMQTDPIGYKDDVNLYAYVGGDPVNKTDPHGRDAVVVNDTFFPGFPGVVPRADHQAILIGNNKTGWTYISKDGAEGKGAWGPSMYTVQRYGTLAEALVSPEMVRYDRAYRTSATAKQDQAMIAAAMAEVVKDYNVLFCNCGDVVQKALEAAGIPFREFSGNPANTEETMQNSPAWTRVPLAPVAQRNFSPIGGRKKTTGSAGGSCPAPRDQPPGSQCGSGAEFIN